jgi:F-type H+-transporting ATPase subunit gamma
MIRSKEIERRIEANNGLKGIMTAMKAFAGLNIRKTTASLLSIRDYERDLGAAFGLMAGHLPETRRVFNDKGRRIIVLFGSDIGLCGSFNERLAENIANASGKDDSVFVVGRKIKEKLDLAGIKYAESFGSVTTIDGVRTAIVETFSRIIKLYVNDPVTDIVFVFSCLSEKNDAVRIASDPFLPPEPSSEPGNQRKKSILYLPAERVVNEIIGEFLYIRLYKCFMESLLSENWFRFRSMEGALENLDSKIKDLDVLYNFSKQEEITDEIIEIIQSHSLGNSRRH